MSESAGSSNAQQLRDAVTKFLGWRDGDPAVLEALHERYLTSDAPGAPRTSADLEKILVAELRMCVEGRDVLAADHTMPAGTQAAPALTADGHPMPSLPFADRTVELSDENREIDTDHVRDQLVAEYEAFNEAQGLTLGDADEHLFDPSLTLAQLNWVRDFTHRWDRNECLAVAQRRGRSPR